MSILVVGDWRAPMHEAACHDALRTIVDHVSAFAWSRYLGLADAGGGWRRWLGRAQNKFLVGPAIGRINRDLVRQAVAMAPGVIFIYRGTHIRAATLQELRTKLPGACLVSYNNDDPFSPRSRRSLWRHFRSGLGLYDVNFVYRPHNVGDYRRAGARNVHLLRSYFIPASNRPVSLDAGDRERFETDVVFAGHFEPDGRQGHLERLVDAGIRLRLFGPEWRRPAARSPRLRRLGPIDAVRGDDYNKAICGARIALCFLSKLNRDVYTRRCFEIPAAGVMMLAEYSHDLATLFTEGVDAEFFRDGDELVRKVEYYLAHDEERRSVARAGFARVHRDGHDVVSRMREALTRIDECTAHGSDARHDR